MMRRPALSLTAGLLSAGTIAGFAGVCAADNFTAPVSFSGASQSFTASVEVSGSVTISGNIEYFVFVLSESASIPTTTVPISVTTSGIVTTNPDGTASIVYSNPDGRLQTIQELNVDLQNGGSIPVSIDSVSIPLNADLIGDLIEFSLTLRLFIGAEVNQLRFDSTGSVDPAFGFFTMPGNITGGARAIISGDIRDVPLVGSVDLGQLIDITETVPLEFPLPGLSSTTELTPDETKPNDLQVDLFFPELPPLEIPFQFSDSFSERIDVDLFEVGVERFDVDYSADFTIKVENLTYDLTGVIPNALTVPACIVDLVDDDALNLFDAIEFILAFNNGDLKADLTGDGSIDLADAIEFITAFNEGCDF